MAEPLPGSGGVDTTEVDAAEAKAQQGLLEGITAVSEVDVLCGRGGAALRHPGNQTYRRLVNLNKGLYITCLKTEKLKISRSIVAAIREQKGRFLEKDNKNGSWFDIGDKKAIEKTSQALREGQPKLRQKIVEMGGGAVGAVSLMESNFGPTAATLFADADYVSDSVSGSNHTAALDGSMNAGISNSHTLNNMPPPQDMAAMAAAMRSMQPPPPQPQQRQHSGQYHQHQQQSQQHHQSRRHPGQPSFSHPGQASLTVDDFLLQHADSLQNLSLHDMSETHLQRSSSQPLQQLSSSQSSQRQQQQQQQQQREFTVQNNNVNSFRQRILRPSLVGRPGVPQELGMQQDSQLSLMSDFSSFGTSGHTLHMAGSGNSGGLVNESLLSLGMNSNDSYRGGGGGGHGTGQQQRGSLTMAHASTAPSPLSSALSSPGEFYSEDDQGGSTVNSRQGMANHHHQHQHQQQQQQQQQQHYPPLQQHQQQPNVTLSTGRHVGGGRESNINTFRSSDSTAPTSNRSSSSVEDIDRRRVFAKMKYSRPPSDRSQHQNVSSTHRVSQQQQQQQQQQNLPHASLHSLGDGMPDIFMVESSLSLHSNLSTMTDGNSKKHLGLGSSSHHQNNMVFGGSNHHMSGSSSHLPSGTGGGGSNSNQAAPASAAAQLPAGVELGKVVDHSSNSSSRGMESGSSHNYFPEALLGSGSRHSIMSGLSRISDTSLNDGGDGTGGSIFSDLSRKIGNASTRSMAMSDISGIDIMREREDEDNYDDEDDDDDQDVEDDDDSQTQDFAGEGEN